MSIELTPTETLIMEVLSARRRLGEPHWPFQHRFRRSLERLQGAGYLSYESDPTGNWRAWLNSDPGSPAAPWLTGPIDYRPIYGTDPDDLALQWARHALDWLVDPLHSVIGVAVDPDAAVVLWIADESNAWQYIDQWSPDCPVPVRVRYIDDYDVHYLAAPGECKTCKARNADRGIDAADNIPWWAWRRRRFAEARRRIREAVQDAGYEFPPPSGLNPIEIDTLGGAARIDVTVVAPWLGPNRCKPHRFVALSLTGAVDDAIEWFDTHHAPPPERGAATADDAA